MWKIVHTNFANVTTIVGRACGLFGASRSSELDNHALVRALRLFRLRKELSFCRTTWMGSSRADGKSLPRMSLLKGLLGMVVIHSPAATHIYTNSKNNLEGSSQLVKYAAFRLRTKTRKLFSLQKSAGRQTHSFWGWICSHDCHHIMHTFLSQRWIFSAWSAANALYGCCIMGMHVGLCMSRFFKLHIQLIKHISNIIPLPTCSLISSKRRHHNPVMRLKSYTPYGTCEFRRCAGCGIDSTRSDVQAFHDR